MIAFPNHHRRFQSIDFVVCEKCQYSRVPGKQLRAFPTNTLNTLNYFECTECVSASQDSQLMDWTATVYFSSRSLRSWRLAVRSIHRCMKIHL